MICDDPSHPGKVVHVARLHLDATGWRDHGTVTRDARRAAREDAEQRGVTLGIPRRHRANERTDSGFEEPRYKFRLVCPLCGLDVQARAERLSPVLDTLVSEVGVDRISLRALGAKLT